MAIIVSGSMGIDSLDAYFLMSVFSLGVFNTGGCLFLIIFLRLISFVSNFFFGVIYVSFFLREHAMLLLHCTTNKPQRCLYAKFDYDLFFCCLRRRKFHGLRFATGFWFEVFFTTIFMVIQNTG